MANKAQKLDLATLSVDEAIDALNKKFGAGTIVRASQAKNSKLSFISSGVYAFDFATGGGFPENRMTGLRGNYSTFKSTIALLGAANFQRKYSEGQVAYVDAEKAFDPIYAEKLGCDLDRILLVTPDSGEQAVDSLNDVLTLPTDMFAIIDSIAALTPASEIEGTMDQQYMGLHARLVNRALRILTARLKRSMYDDSCPSTTVIAINQLREKIGVVFGPNEVTPGGKGKEFAFSIEVRMSASVAKENVVIIEEERNKIKRKVRYGQRVEFKVLKNKCGGPQHEEGEFMWYERAYKGHKPFTADNVDALFHYGAFLDVITWKPGIGFKYNLMKAKNEFLFLQALRNADIRLHRQLYREILAKIRPAITKKQVVRLFGE